MHSLPALQGIFYFYFLFFVHISVPLAEANKVILLFKSRPLFIFFLYLPFLVVKIFKESRFFLVFFYSLEK